MNRRHLIVAASAALAAPRVALASTSFPVERTDAEWRALLSPEAYAVLRGHATEAAHSHPYDDLMAPGTYHCAGCAEPVYASTAKFASDSGWPAFDRAITGRVGEGPDPVYGAMLPEAHCLSCGGHLGHVFNDGPEETTGRRHCINGVALSFVPA